MSANAEAEILDIIKTVLPNAMAEQATEIRETAIKALRDEMGGRLDERDRLIKQSLRQGAMFDSSIYFNDAGTTEKYEHGKGVRFMTYLMRAAVDGTGGLGSIGDLRGRASNLAKQKGHIVTATALAASDLADGGALRDGSRDRAGLARRERASLRRGKPGQTRLEPLGACR